MEYIGNRISIKKKKDETSIVILSTADKMKKILLLLAFLLWTASGLIVLIQYFGFTDRQTKLILIVWLSFWAYFEYRIFQAYRWRSFGIEKIKLRNGKLLYKRDIAKRGKVNLYDFEMIKNFRILEPSENSFIESINNSYWVVGGEKIGFDYTGKQVKLGLQLEDADVKALFTLLQKKIK